MCCTAHPLPPLVFRFNCNVERASNLLVIQLLQLEFNCNVEKTSTPSLRVIFLWCHNALESCANKKWPHLILNHKTEMCSTVLCLKDKLKKSWEHLLLCIPFALVFLTSHSSWILLSLNILLTLLSFVSTSTFYWHCLQVHFLYWITRPLREAGWWTLINLFWTSSFSAIEHPSTSNKDWEIAPYMPLDTPKYVRTKYFVLFLTNLPRQIYHSCLFFGHLQH